MKAKLAITLVAAILIAAGVFTFVAYTTFDAVGFGSEVVYGEAVVPTWGTNQTITLRFSPIAQPVVTFWNLTGGAVPEVNGTVATTNITWNSANQITIFQWNWTGAAPTGGHDGPPSAPYGYDTAYLKFNYTSYGGAAKAIVPPVIILTAVMAIVVIAGYLVHSASLGGKKGGGRKSFP